MGMDNLQDPLETLRNSCNKVSLLLEAHIFEAIHLFSKNNTTILPIIKQDQYLGYISMSDIIKKIGETTELNTNTSIIIISTINKDYSLNEITRLIEENNGKIMTLWNDFKKDKIDIHLLITCPNSQRIIQALERYDYSITETFVKNSNSSNLDERFESFLKYLNP